MNKPINQVNRLLLCGGGSGGHLQPAIAIAKEFLTNNNKQVFFIVSKSILDQEIIKSTGFSFATIHTGKLRRYWSLENLTDFFNFFYGIGESFFIIKKFKPEAIFTKGGFVSLPVALAAYILRIPIIAHESDTISGLANNIIAKFATKICTTFNLSHKDKNHYCTGTPLRPQIYQANSQTGKQFLNFKYANLPLVVFMGASQGAMQINYICQFVLSQIKTANCQFNLVLIAGKNKLLNEKNEYFREYEYLNEEFFHVLASADLVISRAGANSLFELAYLSKASLIIPLASSANNHQWENAKFFAKSQAIELINPNLDQSKLNQLVLDKINYYLNNLEAKACFSQQIKKLSNNNASTKIVEIINEIKLSSYQAL